VCPAHARAVDAAQMRKRAMTMAWTPGLVMDYARALQAIVHPVPLSWFERMPCKWRSANGLPSEPTKPAE